MMVTLSLGERAVLELYCLVPRNRWRLDRKRIDAMTEGETGQKNGEE